MKIYYKKSEILGISVILFLLIFASYLGYQSSMRRARDNQRNLDLGELENGIIAFQGQFGSFPLSTADGKIIACRGDITSKTIDPSTGKPKLSNMVPCQWGKDRLSDPTDINYPPFVSVIPQDPQAERGITYLYYSNGKTFQIYASLETKSNPLINEQAVKRNLLCGKRLCNYGKSFNKTPLDKPL